jgi:HTH-type transcriptional regulator, transcriptional repressor of NAD biosynthesis genes
MKRVCFYGPESTGKSFLAERLASIYNTEFVPEVAKEFITSNDFTIEDIIRIGREQVTRTRLKEKTANKILICDTDLITTQIYSRVYLGDVPDILFDLEQEVSYDQYFLFDIDVPWVPDGMRDLSHRRQEMYNAFRNELIKRNIPFIPVAGNYEQRERIVRNEIDRLIGLRA